MYVKVENNNTTDNLIEKVRLNTDEISNNIIVEFDVKKIDQSSWDFLTQLPNVLKDSGSIGKMEYGIFKFNIKSLENYEGELIKCDV